MEEVKKDEATEIKEFFFRENKFTDHYELQKNSPGLYKSVLTLLLKQGVDLSVGKFFLLISLREYRFSNILLSPNKKSKMIITDFIRNKI